MHEFAHRALWYYELVLAHRRTDSHVTTKIFKIDGLPNFLRYRAPLDRLWQQGLHSVHCRFWGR